MSKCIRKRWGTHTVAKHDPFHTYHSWYNFYIFRFCSLLHGLSFVWPPPLFLSVGRSSCWLESFTTTMVLACVPGMPMHYFFLFYLYFVEVLFEDSCECIYTMRKCTDTLCGAHSRPTRKHVLTYVVYAWNNVRLVNGKESSRPDSIVIMHFSRHAMEYILPFAVQRRARTYTNR